MIERPQAGATLGVEPEVASAAALTGRHVVAHPGDRAFLAITYSAKAPDDRHIYQRLSNKFVEKGPFYFLTSPGPCPALKEKNGCCW